MRCGHHAPKSRNCWAGSPGLCSTSARSSTWTARSQVAVCIALRGTLTSWYGIQAGTTTVLLARACREVVGTDVSRDCIERARQKHPGVQFEVLDAFDVRAALGLGKTFTKIYVDLSGFSGYRALLDVIALLTMYATVLRPDIIVVKSGALKHFAAHCAPWREGHESFPGHHD